MGVEAGVFVFYCQITDSYLETIPTISGNRDFKILKLCSGNHKVNQNVSQLVSGSYLNCLLLNGVQILVESYSL